MYSSPFISQITELRSLERKGFAMVVEHILTITWANFTTHITHPISSPLRIPSFLFFLLEKQTTQLLKVASCAKDIKIYSPQMRKGSCNCLPRITKHPPAPPVFPFAFLISCHSCLQILKNSTWETLSSSAMVLNF